MTNKTTVNIKRILRRNPQVDATQLARNMAALAELRKNGVQTGPNYNLGTPFSRPSVVDDGKAETRGFVKLRDCAD